MDNGINMVLLDALTLGDIEAIKEIEALGKLTIYDTTSPISVVERIRGNEVVITNKVVIDKKIMESCPELRLICITATGTNNVDLDYAAEHGIEVKNVAGYSTDSVAQTTFSLLLSLLTQIRYFDDYVKSGNYSNSPVFTHHGASFWELKGKRFGVVGLGSIGKKVATIASAFGAEVIYYSTTGKNNDSEYRQVSFDDLLAEADIISIHCPLTAQTENLFAKDEFRKMKDSSIILNTGRGKIINESDLAEALNEGLIKAAGLDVLAQEPIAANNPLLKITKKERLIITPHIAWISKEARETLIKGVTKNIKDWASM